jgi:hypothetical protein
MTDGECKMPFGKWNMTVPQNFSSAFMEEIPGLVRPNEREWNLTAGFATRICHKNLMERLLAFYETGRRNE